MSEAEKKKQGPYQRPEASPERTHERAREISARCPFCHESIEVAESGWICCKLCLARHHRACWTEHGSCASCGETGSLAYVPTREPGLLPTAERPASRATASSRALSFGLASLGVVLLALWLVDLLL